MRKRILICICMITSLVMTSCGENSQTSSSRRNEKVDSQISEYTYKELSKMDQSICNGDQITIILPEDQALPYRWTLMNEQNDFTLVEDEVVEKGDTLFAVGSDSAYHVFLYEWTGENSTTIQFKCIHLYDSEDCIDTYAITLSRVDGNVVCDDGIEEESVVTSQNQVTTDTDSATDTDSTTDTDNAVDTDSITDTAEESVPESFSVTAIGTGDVMTVKPGFSYSYVQIEKDKNARNDASIYLPDLESWSGTLFDKGIETYDRINKYYNQYYYTDNTSNLSMIEDYLDLLSTKYNFKISAPSTLTGYSGTMVTYQCSYLGTASFTYGSVYKSGMGSSDMIIYTYTDLTSDFVGISYPSELYFMDMGDRSDGSSVTPETVTFTDIINKTDYEKTYEGYDKFTAVGFGADASDSIYLSFYSDVTETGAQYEKPDFLAQSASGGSALYSLRVCFQDMQGDTVIGWSLNSDYEKYYQDVQVTIVEQTDAYTVVHYYIQMCSQMGTEYTFEGLLASEISDDYTYTADQYENDSPVYTGADRCTRCSGSGYVEEMCMSCSGRGEKDCSSCSGTGRKSCTYCGGDGYKYDSLNGEDRKCTYCYGYGYKDCSKCSGHGKVDCSNCSGSGKVKKKCTTCGGDGIL